MSNEIDVLKVDASIRLWPDTGLLFRVHVWLLMMIDDFTLTSVADASAQTMKLLLNDVSEAGEGKEYTVWLRLTRG